MKRVGLNGLLPSYERLEQAVSLPRGMTPPLQSVVPNDGVKKSNMAMFASLGLRAATLDSKSRSRKFRRKPAGTPAPRPSL